MEHLAEIAGNIGKIAAGVTLIGGFVASILLIINAVRCLLRSEMLRIYYSHKDEKALPRYSYENFMLLYEAYRKLHGNSFIVKIHGDIQTWEISD